MEATMFCKFEYFQIGMKVLNARSDFGNYTNNCL